MNFETFQKQEQDEMEQLLLNFQLSSLQNGPDDLESCLNSLNGMSISTEEKQVLLDQLEVQMEAGKQFFQKQAEQILNSFRFQCELELNKLPKEIRNLSVQEFVREYNADSEEYFARIFKDEGTIVDDIIDDYLRNDSDYEQTFQVSDNDFGKGIIKDYEEVSHKGPKEAYKEEACTREKEETKEYEENSNDPNEKYKNAFDKVIKEVVNNGFHEDQYEKQRETPNEKQKETYIDVLHETLKDEFENVFFEKPMADGKEALNDEKREDKPALETNQNEKSEECNDQCHEVLKEEDALNLLPMEECKDYQVALDEIPKKENEKPVITAQIVPFKRTRAFRDKQVNSRKVEGSEPSSGPEVHYPSKRNARALRSTTSQKELDQPFASNRRLTRSMAESFLQSELPASKRTTRITARKTEEVFASKNNNLGSVRQTRQRKKIENKENLDLFSPIQTRAKARSRLE
ncbi:hypothetical protein G9A89_007585 [Geosiphon pyriformis]|nr:hypothetical protein G9A89_007585 [Geosiphon pyriformis]